MGIVHGQAILGMNFLKDFFASVRDVVGGRTKSYEKGLIKAREDAIREMCRQAAHLRAHAVVGVTLDSELLGEKNGMIMVTATGTAVRLEGGSDPEPEPEKEADGDAPKRSPTWRTKARRRRH